jgi:hypothetical protein
MSKAGPMFFASKEIEMPNKIKISGMVTDQAEKPVMSMVICIYRDSKLLDRISTDETGHYMVELGAGLPVTICFNPGQSMLNKTKYNPSVVANLPARKDAVIDRIVLEAGMDGTQETFMDAIAAYGFLATWRDRGIETSDTGSAPLKLAMIKMLTPVVADFQIALSDYFRSLPEEET